MLLSPVLGRVASQRNPDCRFREMNRSQSYKGRTGRPWLSQLLAHAAFPSLAVALAVSQVNIRHHKKDALRQLRLQSNEVQVDNSFGRGADKYGARYNGKSSVQRADWAGKRISPRSVFVYNAMGRCNGINGSSHRLFYRGAVSRLVCLSGRRN